MPTVTADRLTGIGTALLRAAGATDEEAPSVATGLRAGKFHMAFFDDRPEEMVVERGCDGFVIAATYVPGSYADFVRHVVPELQRRGLYHTDYAGTTLRDNLGLSRPVIGGWKTRPRAAAE
jgi:hypothetical protein